MEGHPLKRLSAEGRISIQMYHRINACAQKVWIELGLGRVEWRTYSVTVMDNNIFTNNLTLNKILGFF
jgi:hypothetical protein